MSARPSVCLLLSILLLSVGQGFVWAQQSPRPRTPRSANQPAPRVIFRPDNPVQQRPAAPRQPAGFPLSPQQEQEVDQILNYWEQHTSRIKTYQAKFVRKNFDFVFGSKTEPKTVDVGTIRYHAPDKGLMRVEKVYDVDLKATDPKKKYVPKPVDFGEYWVCDGDAIFQFDSRTKTLTETLLPPEMRGKAIGEGPLPFLFGAKAESMKARYWIRRLEMKDNPRGVYLLEAIPKRQEDAANFSRLLVKLSLNGKQLFPSAMRLYNKQGRIDYEFEDHRPNDPRHYVASFLRHFVRPKTPSGWTKVTEDWSGNRTDQQAARRAESATR